MKSIRYPLLLIIFYVSQLVAAQYSKMEEKIGAGTYKMVESSVGFYHDEQLLNVVKRVGQRLEKNLDKDYKFKYYLVDTPDLNAFATAGGYVYVTRGLLAIINTEDELAGVMAHEFEHVVNKHVPKKIMANIVPLILELPANIVGLLTQKEFADIINFPIETSSKLAISTYSRSQEKEADLLGIELAIKSGYNPYGLPNALENLTRFIESSHPGAMKKSIFIDHPMTVDRINYLSTIIKEHGLESQKPKYEGAKISQIDGLIYGQNPIAGLVMDNKFIHPDINFYCEFPKNWNIQNSPVSVVALSPEKKASIIISIDSTSQTPRDAALKFVHSFDKSNIVLVDSSNVNEFNAVKVSIRNRHTKSDDILTEIMWLKQPNSKYILKVIGVSKFNDPDLDIAKSFATYRLLKSKDIDSFSYHKIAYKVVKEDETVDYFLNTHLFFDKEKDFLLLLNCTDLKQNISGGSYLKVISDHKIVR